MTADLSSSMLGINFAMQTMFVAWIVLVWLIVRRTIATGSVGLPAALVLTMTFLYGGCFVYAVPGYTHLRTDGHWYLYSHAFSEMMVVRATFASLLGVLGFAIGCGIFSRQSARRPQRVPTSRPVSERNIMIILVGVGLLGYAVHFLRISFPMSSAFNEFGRHVSVAAIVIGAYLARRDGRSLLVWLVLSALIPLYYLFIFGFVSYGFLFGIILISFWMAQLRGRSAAARFWNTLFVPFAIWVTLTAFVAWFSFRNEVRLVVWQQAEGSVFEILLRALSETELFSPWNFASLDLINIRLNLPLFIGKMIEQHSMYPELQQYGATLIILPLVLLPRFLWPGKPTRGGSDFMEEHTGMVLSDTATFGTGTVFEFFINFGYAGVLLGFIALGWIIRQVDRSAADHLAAGNLFGFARLFVVGIIAIDPLLRPFFIVNGAVFAWILMTTLKLIVGRFINPTVRLYYSPEATTGIFRARK